MNLVRKPFGDLLKKAGITPNGPNPYDIQIHDQRLYGKLILEGPLGLGESYVNKWWSCRDIPGFIKRLIKAGGDRQWIGITGLKMFLAEKFQNRQSRRRSHKVIDQHYDIGNDVYEPTLGRTMAYTCGYWRKATSLDEAEDQKHDVVCRKLRLKQGQRVLDIGGGWGSFAKYAAEHYKVKVTIITISREQIKYAKEYCKGLDVDILYMDYRDLSKNFANDPFDHVVSIGMFEHVGRKNYRIYMEQVRSVLKPDGLFLLHAIGGVVSGFEPFIAKYIFPGGYIPSLGQVDKAIRRLFVMENMQNIGADYAPTLKAWWENFDRAWPEIEKSMEARGEDTERFYRAWKYYMHMCAGAFAARTTQVWQFVLSPNGIEGGYDPVY